MLINICGSVSLWLFQMALWLVGTCKDPLHLSPFLERSDIRSALELSEVRDPQKVIPKSYAGFITVDKQLGNHMFFWFFPAISEPLAPVLVWLNGGPAISSMLGLLRENGPIRVTETISATGDKTSYKRWEKSWAESFAMLYIDNPVGAGYSYSDSGQRGWKTTNDGYTQDLFSFIIQFYILFPDYLNTQLYIGGQSYAGRFVPALAYRIHKEIKANRSSIPLAGIYMGGPFFDPYTQGLAQGLFYYSLGAISYAEYLNHQKSVRELFDRNDTDRESMASIIDKIVAATPYIEENYLTRVQPDYRQVQVLMNSKLIRDMVHVGSKRKFLTFNKDLHARFKSDAMLSTKPQLAEIMNNYKVLIYSGDMDGITTDVGTEEAIMTIPWFSQISYNNNTYRNRWYNDGTILGYYTHAGEFCRVIVRNAGHQTPYDQPDATQKMMLDFVRHGCIQASAAKKQITAALLTTHILTALMMSTGT
ncbi:unnamed protein product [Candidula unifasciata]|uniref:Serine carboxypeptidase n=1 Tax=Candidula unifasciata TaxID=100452 RepID=A0A8S3ZGW7_9EUPU|nr:unnamed protein product [Candidula unifasciata]